MKNKLLVIAAALMVIIAFLAAIGQINASPTLFITTPDYTQSSASINTQLQNSSAFINGLNGGAAISLGATAISYNNPSSIPQTSNPGIGFNVSIATNTRYGEAYDHYPLAGMNSAEYASFNPIWTYFTDFSYDGVRSYPIDYTNLLNNSGFWFNLPSGFTFVYYGVPYRNWGGTPMNSSIWICTNGFMSLDNSNSTSTGPANFPSTSPPTAVIAPFWTSLDFISGTSQIVVGIACCTGSTFAQGNWLVIEWQNMGEHGTGNLCTFGAALRIYYNTTANSVWYFGDAESQSFWDENNNNMLPSSPIWFFYPTLPNPIYSFAYGLEDQTGYRSDGYGGICSPTNAAQLNQNATEYFVDYVPYVHYVYLTLRDSNQKASATNPVFYLVGVTNNLAGLYGSGLNLNTTKGAIVQPGGGFIGTVIGTLTGATTFGDAIWSVGEATMEGLSIGVAGGLTFGLAGVVLFAAQQLYNAYSQCQYSNVMPASIGYGQNGSIGISAQGYDNFTKMKETAMDACLETGFYWTFPTTMTSDTLTITATVQYALWEGMENYDIPNSDSNVSTSVSFSFSPRSNTGISTAQSVTYGFYGSGTSSADPLSYIAAYGYSKYSSAYYNITLPQTYETEVSVCSTPTAATLWMYVTEPNGVLLSSANSATSSTPGILQDTFISSPTAGTYTILINCTQGSTFYNITITNWGYVGGRSGGGGCPYVYDWNGSGYVKDNNILPASENGNGTDTKDYYMLQQPLVPVFSTKQKSVYSLQIGEFENNVDYINQAELIAVDHPEDTSIAVTQQGQIIAYKSLASPITCVDNNGNNELAAIDSMNGNVSDPSTYYQGNKGDWLLLDFGRVTGPYANLILRDDMKCAECIDVQVPNATGGWQTVDVLNPRDYWSIEAVNMAAYLPKTGDFIVRLLWTQTHRLDYVGLDTSPSAPVQAYSAPPTLAIHSTMGDVTAKLMYDDTQSVELVNGQYITLWFTLPTQAEGTTRSFILYTDGYYYTITS